MGHKQYRRCVDQVTANGLNRPQDQRVCLSDWPRLAGGHVAVEDIAEQLPLRLRSLSTVDEDRYWMPELYAGCGGVPLVAVGGSSPVTVWQNDLSKVRRMHPRRRIEHDRLPRT